MLQLDKAQTTVKRVTWLTDVACSPGPAATSDLLSSTSLSGDLRNAPVSPAGVWSATTTQATPQPDGGVVTLTLTGTARRSGNTMTGWLRGQLVSNNPAGENIVTCDSGLVPFRLTQRNVFGGVTVGQLNPIAVTMNAARTRVVRLRWDWKGSCTLGPAARPDSALDVFFGDVLANLRVARSGQWGGPVRFDPKADAATGVTQTYEYNVRARRRGVDIRGWVEATLIETDSVTGAEMRRCTSGRVVFRLRD